MATVINNPGTSETQGGVGFLIGALLLLIFAVVLIAYIVPAIRQGLSAPSTQISVPERVEVDVNTPTQE